jgi:DNA invertase Pin-like site-specific DNA recombinase
MTLRDSGVSFVAADLPEANTMTVGVMAVVAQHEREAISARTKAALAAAKRRGKTLGGHRKGAPNIKRWQRQGVEAAQAKAAERLRDVADDLRGLAAEGLSLNAMARRLNSQDVKASRGGSWTATAVRRALAQLSSEGARALFCGQPGVRLEEIPSNKPTRHQKRPYADK